MRQDTPNRRARMALLLVVPLAVALGPAPLDARTIHVSPAGTATGDGSTAAPFSTPEAAVGAAAVGDTILLRQGTYPVDHHLYLAVSGVTLTGLSGEKAILAGVTTEANVLPAVIQVAADGVVLSNLTVLRGFYGVKIESAG